MKSHCVYFSIEVNSPNSLFDKLFWSASSTGGSQCGLCFRVDGAIPPNTHIPPSFPGNASVQTGSHNTKNMFANIGKIEKLVKFFLQKN
jgi:hypothetical protein